LYFSEYIIIEGNYLRLKRALRFLTGEGETCEGITKVFPNTISILNPNPTRFNSSTRRAFMAKIKKGSQNIRKHLTRNDDFITPAKISSWQKYHLREAGNILDANIKEKLLRFLCRKTLFNNQLSKVFPGNKPAWYTGPNCDHCETNLGVGILEILKHALETCFYGMEVRKC
jgi:hypothetical protein